MKFAAAVLAFAVRAAACDYAPPADGVRAPRAVAILVEGARTLAPLLSAAGYGVCAVAAGAGGYPEGLAQVRAAIRSVRVRAKRIALLGSGAGAHLVNLAGMDDPGVQAVVSLAGWSDLRGQPLSDRDRAWFGDPAAASPVMRIRLGAPPFLLIHGDADGEVPLVQSTHWQSALHAAGVRCNLIVIPGGGADRAAWSARRDWEGEMLAWLGAVLGRRP